MKSCEDSEESALGSLLERSVSSSSSHRRVSFSGSAKFSDSRNALYGGSLRLLHLLLSSDDRAYK
jgi:hypothetical protein